MNSGLVIENGVLSSAPLNIREVSIPAEVTRIGKRAFKDCQVENVTFEGSALRSIDEEAFLCCSCLKCIVVPDGVIQIADRAFAGCTSLKYVSIPDSVLLIGKGILDDCSSDLFVIGKENTEAGKIASQYGLALRSDSQSTISAFEKANSVKAALETKVFDIFGEEVSCPNTLVKYYNIIEYYSEQKDPLFTECITLIPTKLSGRFGNLADPLTRERNMTIDRLASQGVYIQDKNLNSYLLEPMKLILEVAKLLSKAYTAVQKGITSEIDQNRDALKREAESKVTGLSYTTYSSSMLTLIGHELDDYNERKRQRREAYAVAEKKFAQMTENAKNEGEKKYAEFVSQALPILRQGTDSVVEALCKAETDNLIKAGLIDESVETDFDPEKSAQLMKSIANKMGDNSFTVALALKKFPGNMTALVYAKEHGYECQGLTDLVQFLNLERELETSLEENRKARYVKIYSSLLNVKNADSGIELIKENEASLQKKQVEQLIIVLAKTLSDILVGIPNSAISSGENVSVTKCQEYCTSQLNGIISSDAWSFFLEHGVSPIHSSRLKKTDDYYELRDWLSEKLFINIQERAQRRIAAEVEEQERQIKAKKAKKKRITIISILSALIVVGIIFAIVYVKVIIPIVKYKQAVQLMNEGKYSDAYRAFETMKGFKDVDDLQESVKAHLLSEAEVGTHVYFGSYEQDDNVENGKEDIEWIVLERDGDRILVVSNYALAFRAYEGVSDREAVSWQFSSIRSWLNTDFYRFAFSSEEKGQIVSVGHTSDDTLFFSELSPSDYTDDVFLLSETEVEKYLSSEQMRECQVTDYARKLYPYSMSHGDLGDTCDWWLRTNGEEEESVAYCIMYVTSDGSVKKHGRHKSHTNVAVRPAMWLYIGS